MDNVIVAQELVYNLENKKGKAAFMVIKLDLEKTYDRLEWSFVRSMMFSLGFHEDTVELVMSCISSTSATLLFNGSQLEIVQLLGINETSNLGKYLGYLILHKRRCQNDFQFMVERVQAKLAGWKTECLSPAGWLVLIKAAVTAIPEYTMQCYKILVRICDEVEKLVRNFL